MLTALYPYMLTISILKEEDDIILSNPIADLCNKIYFYLSGHYILPKKGSGQ